ncbi:proteasome activator complex subunit 4A isoform X2 [Hyalella azteca]|uniref:Proteasome activator complex subunit 4A isoform X2 n=1 Tax=Hyalella azteca TaxID=294128 RepID=A0A8B7NBX3_HYAAZ|nr:proteasome activator complex subunit 4A isoform X2 [Hyalella azteca]
MAEQYRPEETLLIVPERATQNLNEDDREELDDFKFSSSMGGDEMEDGFEPDIKLKGGLGFIPQRRNLSNNLLPYSNHLDAEIVEELKNIKLNLTKALVASDLKCGGLTWIYRLHRFIKLYGYCFSKEDHVAFIELLYELIVAPGLVIRVVIRLCQTLLLLLKKITLLTPDDIQLQWRPLYELHCRFFHCAVAKQGMLRVPIQTEGTINSVIRHCRAYFAPGTTEELLEEFVPRLCPFDEQMNRSMKYLDMFLPVVTRHHGKLPNFGLWKDFLLDQIENSPYWEAYVFGIVSRLAWRNIGIIDWQKDLPLFFTKLLRSLGLPVGYRGMAGSGARHCDSTNVAMFIVANLGGGSCCQEQLSRFIGVVESYLHPSNSGHWTSTILDIFCKITLYFNKRINREQRPPKEPSWESKISESMHLTEADVDAFVESLLPVILTAVFGKSGAADASITLGRLAALRTSLVMTKFLELMYPALSSSSEPQRLQSVLQTGVLTALSIVTGGSDFPAGPTHILPLLHLLLPGIDPNDITKTMATFQLVTTFATLIPIADCSSAASDPNLNLTEVEMELCHQSAEVGEFLLMFLERCFCVVESCVSAEQQTLQPSQADFGGCQHALMSREETLIEAGMSFTIRAIFQQSHPEIAKLLVRRLASYAIERTLETGVSGRLLANICRAAARAQPELVLSALVPPLTRQLESLLKSESVLHDETPDNEFMFNLLLLSEVLSCRCDVAVQYVHVVMPVLEGALGVVCLSAQKMAATLYGNLLASLATSSPVDFCSFTNDWNEPYSSFLPIRHWGALISGGWSAMKVKWVQPGPEEKAALTLVLNSFLLPHLAKLQAAALNLASVTKEELNLSLLIVQESLNAGPVLPLWQEEPIQLEISSAPEKPHYLILSEQDVSIELDINGKPSNVRLAIADAVLDLVYAMLGADSDNTKAYTSIVNILWSVALLHSLKRVDFESRWRNLSQVQRMLRNNLVGPEQHWHRMRHVIVQRAHLQHLSRTLEFIETLPFTNTHKRIMDAGLKLSTSNYSQVRKGGQQLLRNFFAQFPSSCELLVPQLVQNLALDPKQHHKTFKGTLFVLLGAKCKGLVVKQNWDSMLALWPAILAAQHSEKPSISSLLSQLLDNLLTGFELVYLEQQVPESVVKLCQKIARQVGFKRDVSEVESSKQFVEKNKHQQVDTYNKLVENIAQQFQSGKLHWRHEQLAVSMLGILVRPDLPYPAAAVRSVTHALLHHNIHVRKMAVLYLPNVLRNLKRAHKKELLCLPPDAQDNKSLPVLQKFAPSVNRDDNKFLQYDAKFSDMTEEEYNSRQFVHPTYLGFTCWPREVYVYSPATQQPPLDRPTEELSPAELEIYLFFSDEQKIQKLIDLFTLEEQRNIVERFDQRKMMIWKGVFRNYGPCLLPLIRGHLLRLADDTAEASQRCASEILAGLVRATKHWPYAAWKDVMSLATETLTLAFSKMSSDATDNWYRAMTKISMDRDANLFAPLVEFLVNIPDIVSSSSFSVQCRLFVCSSMLSQQEWRILNLQPRLLQQLRPALSHPYKAVRDRVSTVLYNVFFLSTADVFYSESRGFSLQVPESLNLNSFVEDVLTQLGSLQEYSGGNSSGEGLSLVMGSEPRDGTSPQDSLLQHLVPAEVLVGASTSQHGSDARIGATTEDYPACEDASIDVPRDTSSYTAGETTAESSSLIPPIVTSSPQLVSSSFNICGGDNDERKNAFRIINTMCSFVQIMSTRYYSATPLPLYKFLGALCQLESVDSEQEVCSNCVSALCTMGQSLLQQQHLLPLIQRLQEITEYRWWRARSAALGVLQMVVFHNALTMMACDGAPQLVLKVVLARIKDERLEVRNMASQVLSSALHINFVPNSTEIREKFTRELRKATRKSTKIWSSERVVEVHGAVLGLAAFVESAPYSVPDFLPQVLCTLASCINLPQPIAGSIRNSLSNFRRTHHDNWEEHKQHFSSEQLDVLNDLLLSPSYYA